MLRRRPSVHEGGLLWKLQASLHEAMEEQERLRGCAGQHGSAPAALLPGSLESPGRLLLPLKS